MHLIRYPDNATDHYIIGGISLSGLTANDFGWHSVHLLFEELYTAKTNPNATIIARTELTSSIHMTTHL